MPVKIRSVEDLVCMNKKKARRLIGALVEYRHDQHTRGRISSIQRLTHYDESMEERSDWTVFITNDTSHALGQFRIDQITDIIELVNVHGRY